uniref:Uncharacterized protein n=1 Tax=Anguilla anguilla TaxID=7936 RepID=A0A0E9P7A1_ANGAN
MTCLRAHVLKGLRKHTQLQYHELSSLSIYPHSVSFSRRIFTHHFVCVHSFTAYKKNKGHSCHNTSSSCVSGRARDSTCTDYLHTQDI